DEYTYDTTRASGNIKQIRKWNSYSGVKPTTPDRVIDIGYLIDVPTTGTPYVSNNILDRPVSVTESSGSTWLSQTNYGYDTTALGSGTTGVIQHDDTNYSSTNTTRGNLSRVDRLLASGAVCPSATCLETLLSYDITGQARQVQEPNGAVTNYSY